MDGWPVTERSADSTVCEFCGDPAERGRIGAPAAEGPAPSEGDFCSAGCRDAHRLLGTGGTSPTDQSPEDDPGAGEASPTPESPTNRSEPTDGTVRTFLRVDGMYSATCEAFLESVAGEVDGVEAVAASYVTETVRVDHDPDVVTPERLREALSRLGYTAYLRSDASVEPADSGSAARRARELTGVRKRRDEQFLGLRYAAGILFGAFLLVPYVTILYPVYLAELVEWGFLAHYQGAFQPGGPGGMLFLRIYLVMTGVVVFFTGLPVLRGAYVSLRMRRPTTDLLVACVALGAYLYSTAAVLLARNDVYYDLTIVVVASVTAAAFYEAAVKRRAVDRLTDLTVSQVDTARVSADDGPTEVPVEEVTPDDEVLVREGERVPVSGTVTDGECVVSEAVVTGESLPVERGPADELVAGAVVTDGAAVLRPDDRPASDLERITAAVWDIQSADHGVNRRADRLASRLLPLVVLSAVGAGLAASLLGAGPAESLLAVLLAAFVVGPWALGLATPLSVATSLADALDRGIVVFDETVLERLRGIDVVVLDKTGTLTTGEMVVVDVDCPPELLEAAVAVERRASHPVARAIVRAAESGDASDSNAPDGGASDLHTPDGGAPDRDAPDRDAGPDGGTAADVASFETRGTGVEGVVDGRRILVGTPELFAERGWTVETALADRADRAREAGRVPTLVGRDGAAEGIVVVGDEPRDDWEATVRDLADRGIDVVVLTGDRGAATGFLRDHPAVSHVLAGVSPAGKAEAVRRLTADHRVAMVGDGTNDAMALASADLGISLGGGTALAADAADVTILEDDVAAVATAFDLARAAGRRVRRNLALAFLYNLVAIPVVLVGIVNPVVATAAVVLTAGALVANSARPLLRST